MSSLRGRPEAGFSLIEVLVSIFIVSLGVLALGGLMQSATRYGKMSELRSTATLLDNDIADRIRANLGAQSGGYDNASTTFPSALAPAQADCTSTAPCTPSALAARDLYVWTTRLRSMLPDGSAYIKTNPPGAGSTGRGSVDIWVGWTDPQTSIAGLTERPASECPPAWSGTPQSVRCVYLQVGL